MHLIPEPVVVLALKGVGHHLSPSVPARPDEISAVALGSIVLAYQCPVLLAPETQHFLSYARIIEVVLFETHFPPAQAQTEMRKAQHILC
jgi:hypothetical protein